MTKTAIAKLDREHVLEDFVSESPSAPAALVRTLAAVVCEDDTLSLPEISALADVATRLDESNLSAYMALRSIELRPTFGDSLERLKVQATGLDAVQRTRLLELAIPVLELQGEQALELAGQVAQALQVPLPPARLATLQAQARAPLWKALTTQSIRRMRSSEVIESARLTYKVTRRTEVARALAGFLEGEIDADVLRRRVDAARREFIVELEAVERLQPLGGDTPGMREALLRAARELQAQIEQRLQLIRARIELEKREFDEGLEDLINDAGNAFEVDAMGLMRTGADASGKAMWSQLARSSFGPELERRLNRVERRCGERLRLLKQEVSIFARDYGYAVTQLMASVHHARLAEAMPGLRVGTRVLNAVEDAADVTIAAGAMAAAGTGAAIYFLGAAAVLPVVAPVAPFVAGAVVVAGVIKWMMDRDARNDAEVADKRKALEDDLRKRLQAVRSSYFDQLDQTQAAFDETARALMTPVLLEAYAQARLEHLRERLLDQAIGAARALLPVTR